MTLGASALYAEPSYYDKTYRRRTADVEYYVAVLSKRPGSVLELGAGSGRVTLPLARAGLRVTAVDTSAAMLAALQTKLCAEPAAVQRRVQVVEGDMRTVRVGQRFDWVIAPFNTVLHLYTADDVAGFFATATAHLKPRAGQLVFDYATPRPKDLCLDPERWFKGGRLRHPVTGLWVRYSERFHYSPQRQILSVWSRFEPENGQPAFEVLLTHRQFFPQEMQALLRCHGFADQTWSADFADRPPHAGADVLTVSARPDRAVRALGRGRG